MNIPAGQSTIRAAGFSFVNTIAAMIRAWQAERRERARIEALEALDPEVLDDIGVQIVSDARPPRSMIISHPYVIAATAIGARKRKERGAF